MRAGSGRIQHVVSLFLGFLNLWLLRMNRHEMRFHLDINCDGFCWHAQAGVMVEERLKSTRKSLSGACFRKRGLHGCSVAVMDLCQ